MTSFHSLPQQKSGVPLGGIGTGSIELWPDGAFHAWQIANPEKFSRDCRKHPGADDGESLTGSLSFFLRTSNESGIKLRSLDLSAADNNCRMYSFLKPMESISYTGTFPSVLLDYLDSSLPVSVSLKAASPFVPYEEDTASTPGFYMTFTLRNVSDASVHVSLAAKLKSIVTPGTERCRYESRGAYSAVLISSREDALASPDCGSIALAGAGGKPSRIAGAHRKYMDEYVAHGDRGVSEESFLFGLYRNGCLPDLDSELPPDPSLMQSDPDMLSDEQCRELLNRLIRLPSMASIWERLQHDAADQENRADLLRASLRYLLKNLREISELGAWGDSALCLEADLNPDETREMCFILSWHFPNLYSAAGNRVGHWYESRFRDAWEVSCFLQDRRGRILSEVDRFTDNLYQSSFPPSFSDAVSIHLSTLVKSAWRSSEGDFGIWEGLGSCGFCTTDISYHGTFGLVSLFPDLQLKQMRQSTAFQRDDGAVMHFFSPDFKSVDNGFDRVDMNPQFVLLVCRDWLATGDFSYASEMWPHVLQAMDYTQSLDHDGDGLPDTGTQRNTYDAWRFSGTSAYISVLWLAALKAASHLAGSLGHQERANAWRALEKRGAARLDELLWNGDYYDLWHDGESRDECCMTDQLDGECFCRMIGLEGILDPARVRKTLDSIFELNFSEEGGLVNAGCPEGKHSTLYTFRNCQGEANWSGIEYWIAAFSVLTGRYDRALTLVETVQERHRRLGYVWNHAECGDYYYRPLSSFAVMQALSGMRYDAAAKALSFFDSSSESYSVPWFSTHGYGQAGGSLSQRSLTLVQGCLEIAQIRLQSGCRVQSVRINEDPVSWETGPDNVILFSTPQRLAKKDTLTVDFR